MTPTQKALAGRTALVTGGTDGIGCHTAAALAAQGATVVITGRNIEHGEATAARIRQSSENTSVRFAPVDHLTVGANQELAVLVAESHEKLDILINNVGRVFSTREETADGYERTLALCFIGPVALTDALRPLLQAGDRSRIVNVVSSAYKMWKHDPLDDVQSQNSFVGIQAHAHAKQLNLIWSFALAGSLAGDGITVVATNPGAAWTPGTESLTPQAVPAWKWFWPIVRFFQRRASAEHAAQTPIWLASSPEASALNGVYVEGHKSESPKLAADSDNQRKVVSLADLLIAQAPTAQE